MASFYLFLLGLASGIALLPLVAYRRVSPTWLRWLLMASGLFVMSRYATMALFTHPQAPQRFWLLHHCWFATSLGLTLSSVFAVDQLTRHPAMSPQKLLLWFSPFLTAYGALIAFAKASPAPDPVMGWSVQLQFPWPILLSLTHSLFLLLFLGFCLVLMRKIPSQRIRRALLGLSLGHGYLALDGAVLAMGGWYFRPYLFSEIVLLVALWHAYETGAALQTER